MRLGFSSRAYHGSGWTVSEILAHAGQVGEAVELWLEPPYLASWRTSAEKSDLERIREVLVVRELDLSLHAAKTDVNLASINPVVRKAARQEIEKAFDWGLELGCNVITFHPGGYKHGKDKSLNFLKQELARIDAMATQMDFTVCIENQGAPGLHARTADETLDLLEGLENLRLTLDLAHIQLVGEDPAGFIQDAADYIRHVHISDADKKKKTHEELGAKKTKHEIALQALHDTGYSEAIIIEKMGEDPHESGEKQLELLREKLSEAGYEINDES